MNPKVDHYFAEGCGRCALGGTPACKVHKWPREMAQLRMLLLGCGLTEEVKWDVPCYTFQNSNVIILAAFKEYCALSFFKGALLSDSEGILVKPGENTQAGRMLRFTDVSGRLVQTVRLIEGSHKITLDFAAQAAGVYLIRVADVRNNGSWVVRVVKM